MCHLGQALDSGPSENIFKTAEGVVTSGSFALLSSVSANDQILFLGVVKCNCEEDYAVEHVVWDRRTKELRRNINRQGLGKTNEK